MHFDGTCSRCAESKHIPLTGTRKVRKAEREKLKRDHLNDLFVDLVHSLELSQENCGKASIVTNATRILRDLLTEIETLKKENATLLSESHYVTMERNELKDETSILEADVEKLQLELSQKNASTSRWNIGPFQSDHQTVAPIIVLPLNHNLQACADSPAKEHPTTIPSHITRPYPRYPSSTDLWSSSILTKQSKVSEEPNLSGNGIVCSGSEEETKVLSK